MHTKVDRWARFYYIFYMLPLELGLLKKYILKYKFFYLAGAFLIVLGSSTGMIVPWFFKLVVDNIKRGGFGTYELFRYCLAIVGLSVLSGLFFFIQRITTMNMSRRVECDIRDEIFSHLLGLSQRFYKENSSGDLISRMNNDLGSVRMFLGFGFSTLLRTIFMVSIGVFFMLKLSAKVFVYLAIPIPLFLISMKIFMAKVHEMWEKIQNFLGVITEFAREQISGIRIIRAYARSENVSKEFARLQWDYLKKSMTALKIFGIFEGFSMSIVSITELIIIYVGGREVIAGRMTLGSLIAYHGYLMLLLWPLFGFGWLLSQWERTRA
ncbi:MAG: ABC transporter transmembrane domain-containing protein, partial [bacterium]